MHNVLLWLCVTQGLDQWAMNPFKGADTFGINFSVGGMEWGNVYLSRKERMFVLGIENFNPKTGLKPSSHNWVLHTLNFVVEGTSPLQERGSQNNNDISCGNNVGRRGAYGWAADFDDEGL